jgi:hypothetical protein
MLIFSKLVLKHFITRLLDMLCTWRLCSWSIQTSVSSMVSQYDKSTILICVIHWFNVSLSLCYCLIGVSIAISICTNSTFRSSNCMPNYTIIQLESNSHSFVLMLCLWLPVMHIWAINSVFSPYIGTTLIVADFCMMIGVCLIQQQSWSSPSSGMKTAYQHLKMNSRPKSCHGLWTKLVNSLCAVCNPLHSSMQEVMDLLELPLSFFVRLQK